MSSELKADMFMEGVEFGAEREQRRIIKLLETEASELEGHECTDDCKSRAQELRLSVLLIKGEGQ
jgi:hypothetical protein